MWYTNLPMAHLILTFPYLYKLSGFRLRNSSDSISTTINLFTEPQGKPFQNPFHIALVKLQKVTQMHQFLNRKLQASSWDLNFPALMGRSQTGTGQAGILWEGSQVELRSPTPGCLYSKLWNRRGRQLGVLEEDHSVVSRWQDFTGLEEWKEGKEQVQAETFSAVWQWEMLMKDNGN